MNKLFITSQLTSNTKSCEKSMRIMTSGIWNDNKVGTLKVSFVNSRYSLQIVLAEMSNLPLSYNVFNSIFKVNFLFTDDNFFIW